MGSLLRDVIASMGIEGWGGIRNSMMTCHNYVYVGETMGHFRESCLEQMEWYDYLGHTSKSGYGMPSRDKLWRGVD